MEALPPRLSALPQDIFRKMMRLKTHPKKNLENPRSGPARIALRPVVWRPQVAAQVDYMSKGSAPSKEGELFAVEVGFVGHFFNPFGPFFSFVLLSFLCGLCLRFLLCKWIAMFR